MATELIVSPLMTIAEITDRRNRMVEFVKAAMKEGIDFGKVPGTEKNTLMKPGAEKLNTLFGLTPRFVDVRSVEDWTGADHNGEMFFYYWQKCQLLRDGVVVGEGDGSCNSFEKKYRYRSADRTCPNCGAAAILKSKNAGEGYFCWAKRGGCGAKFADNDPKIMGQQLGQVPNPDIADQVNTLLKMAQKRALVAATLLAVNASEFFTQDLDDMVIEGEFRTVENESKEQARPKLYPITAAEDKQPPRLPAEDEARMAAATKRTPAPTNGNQHTRETFFGLAQLHGLNKEAAKIATAHSKDQDWKAATIELESVLQPA